MHGVAAFARDFLLLADPELEARADHLARAADSSGSRGGLLADEGAMVVPAVAALLGDPRHRARTHAKPSARRTRRPGTPEPAADAHLCVNP
ncbi:MAG: hypothetical protein JHC95_05890 [Solirubrobacteraceae bacterium]|nr:hypothetical protein [Solirubrobacteraceae bacterium]